METLTLKQANKIIIEQINESNLFNRPEIDFILFNDREETSQTLIGVHEQDTPSLSYIYILETKDAIPMKDIKVYKFRTMYENSQEIFNNFTKEQKEEFYKNFKLENDPRVTKIGDFLRRTSIDELPQLINILNGSMSIVGPRPIVQKEIDLYGDYANKLFSVVPGLTGYWQANGRSDTTYEERIKMDMYYIDNRGFWLDFKIIIKTFGSVLKGEGAV